MHKMGVSQPNKTVPRPQAQLKMNGHHGTFDDMNPRQRPSPHGIRAPSAEPTVPEVTIFFDGTSAESSYMDLPSQRAPLADIYGPIQNQRLDNGMSAAKARNQRVPVSQQNGYHAPRPVQHRDEFMDSYPRTDPRIPGAATKRPSPQHVPTSQYPASRPAYPQRPVPQEYAPNNAQANGASRGPMRQPRPTAATYNHSCVPSTMEQQPRQSYQAHQPQNMNGSYGRPPPDPRYQPMEAYPPPSHDAHAPRAGHMQQRSVQYLQPAPGPSRVDPNSQVTLAEAMQNLNIRLKPTSPGSASGSGSDSLNNSSEGSVMTVPPDVYELLRMQDAQLKELREQLAKLLAKQDSQSSQSVPAQSRHAVTLSTQTSMHEPPPRLQGEGCSVGINTSIIQDYPQQTAQTHVASVQTSPPRHQRQQRHSVSSQSVEAFHLSASEPRHHTRRTSPGYRRDTTSQNKKRGTPDNRQGYQRHASPGEHVRPPSSQTSPGDLDHNDSYTLGEIQLAQIQNMQSATEESIMSDMMVDMPAYTSLTPQKTSSGDMADSEDSSGSPGLGESVSMYERGESLYDQHTNQQEDTGYGESTQEPELVVNYKHLLGKVQQFLAKNNNGDNSADTGLNTTNDNLHNQSINSHLDLTEDNTLENSNTNRGGRSGNGNGSVHSATGSLHSQHSGEGALPKSAPTTPAHQPRAVNKSIDYTRRQLEKMGVCMDTTSASDMSRYDQSMFLDTEFLPRVEYESLMLTDDTDLSACADQLAMKYLTDEQLSELAKLKPKTQKRGLGRVTNPNTTLTNPMNHMSFATRKYMERYGLLDGESPDVTQQPDNLVNVTAFLDNLHNASFMDESRGSNRSTHNQTLSQSCSGALPDPSAQSTCSASSISEHHSAHQHYYSDGDSHVGAARPAETAANHRMSTPKAPQSAPRTPDLGATPERTKDKPIRVFDSLKAQAANQQAQNNRPAENLQERRQTDRVLDIERLKELPKLM